MVAKTASGLNLAWALGQLRKQYLGAEPLEAHLHRAGSPASGEAAARLAAVDQPEGSSLTGLSCATPTSSDAATGPAHMRNQQHAHSSGGRGANPLSVHWAEALEQHAHAPHAPHHAHHTPDKPCLKPQQSSFPYLEEAAALEGLMRRPWQQGGSSGGHATGGGQGHGLPVAKKRSRLAAFGQ